jgi:hypothetical protein
MKRLRLFILALAATIAIGTAAFAAGLDDGDYRYLLDRYGLAQDGAALKTLTADQQTQLHDVIDDPTLAQRPETRDANVDDFVFGLETCALWQGTSPCPVSDRVVGASDGKRAADRYCNMCHLVGTPAAPSFYLMAQKQSVTADGLGKAVDTAHTTAMITRPSPGELAAIADYINGLKRK